MKAAMHSRIDTVAANGRERLTAMTHYLSRCAAFCLAILLHVFVLPTAMAADGDYVLGAGDVVKISVFEHPDLASEVRLSESGKISFPLIGEVPLVGMTARDAEARITQLLALGGFIKKPQVNLLVLQFRSQQVSVLGQVNRPGRYPIEGPGKISDFLATAGGIAPTGEDVIKLVRMRDGKPVLIEIDPAEAFEAGKLDKDIAVKGGDVIYVAKAPVFYIYGEVQRPGSFRLEPGMTVMQALSLGGGLTQRGTEKDLKIHRRGGSKTMQLNANLTDALQPNDVVYVKASIF